MNNRSKWLLLAFAGALGLFTVLNQSLLGGYRLDLTENRLYTLSPGSLEIINKIAEPLTFHFFFSEEASRELTSLRAYGDEVESLLNEYVLAAEGKIQLDKIDPVPFSEQEDLAAEFGLQSVPVNTAGEELYFGLAATNGSGQEVVIPFFQPDKQAFLEYDLSRSIQTLSKTQLPKIALLSTLKIESDIDMQTFQSVPAWMLVEQLQQRYDIISMTKEDEAVPEGADLLILVHPKELSDQTLYAIDQFAVSGGRLLIFLDPLAEMEQSANPMMAQSGGASDLTKLLGHWGLEMLPDVVIADADRGLSVGSATGAPVRHIGMLGLGPEQFEQTDIAVSAVGSLNLSSAGILRVAEVKPDLIVQPLISVGPYAGPIPTIRMQSANDPEQLLYDFEPDGKSHHLALRLSGVVASAFTDSDFAGDEHVATTNRFNAVIVSDTDLLSDRLWVQVQDFFGQRIATPFAGNGDLVFNLVDNLAGSSELISLRSRGVYSRPFDVVQELRREAEEQYLASAEELQAELLETETRLAELAQGQEETLSISPEEQAELLRFQEDKLRIRKELRDVRHQLDKDIDDLGTTLKFVNILLVPILLTFLLMVMNFLRLGRAS